MIDSRWEMQYCLMMQATLGAKLLQIIDVRENSMQTVVKSAYSPNTKLIFIKAGTNLH